MHTHENTLPPAAALRLLAPEERERVLAAQAEKLDRMFNEALDKYASQTDVKAARTYANIALKAQACCRMTLLALDKLRKQRLAAKTPNELIRNAPYGRKSPNELVRNAPYGQKSPNELITDDWDRWDQPAQPVTPPPPVNTADGWIAYMAKEAEKSAR